MDVIGAIAEIEKVNLNDDGSPDVIRDIIITKIGKFATCNIVIEAGMPLIRARSLKREEDFHENISDLSYNSNIANLKVGRANLKMAPVFYSAENRITALQEVRFLKNLNNESCYTVSAWRTNVPITVSTIITPELIKANKVQRLGPMGEMLGDFLQGEHADPIIAGGIELFKYFAKKFAEPVQEGEESKYNLTAALSSFIWGRAEGILYQSMQSPSNFNVALKSEVLDEGKLTLELVSKQKFIKAGDLYKEVSQQNTTSFDHSTGKILY